MYHYEFTLSTAWLEEQRQTYLPKIASGELRLQSMGVTPHYYGRTDTTKIKTLQYRKGDHYIVNGQKSGSAGSNIPI